MKNILNILFTVTFFCLLSCNESADIIIPNATPGVGGDTPGSEITFTPEQLSLPEKKGACFTLRSDNYIANMSRVVALNVGWNYSWGSGILPNQPDGVEFVPMTWGGFNPSYVNANILPLVIEGKYKRLLGFNEPDGAKQANMSVEKAIELWPTLESLGIPLGSPAVVDAENGEWIESFMKEVETRGYRVDYICVHNYGGGSASEFKRKIEAIHKKYNRPILITEFAVADWSATTVAGNKHSAAKVLAFMKEVLPWLESTDYVYGYAWFSFGADSPQGCTSALFDKDGNLTELGQYYSSFGNYAPDPDPKPDPDPNPDPDPVVGSNLVLNPGFEDGGANWTGKSNVNYDNKTTNPAIAGNVINGNVTLRFSGVKAWADIAQSVKVEKGKKYKFGFTGRIQDAPGPEGSACTGKSFNMAIRKDKDNVYATTEAIKDSKNTTVQGEITIGDNFPESIQIYISKASGIAYIDDVFFIEVK